MGSGDRTSADAESAAPAFSAAPASPTSVRGPGSIGTTLARLSGAGTTAILVVVADERGTWIVPVFLASIAWFATSTAFVLLRGWSRRQSRATAVIDLAFMVAAIAATGGAESPVVRLLCLAPVAWAVIIDRTTVALLVLLGGLSFVAVWAPDALDGTIDGWPTLAAFMGTYLASAAVAYVALRLRDDSDAHTARLAEARRALTRELGQVERDERERLAIQLHDGPLQTVISARQDLVDHLDGDPDALEIGITTLDESIAALRGVASDLFPDQDGGANVREQLRSIAAAWEARGGFEIRLAIDEAVGERADATLVGMVAELVGNAGKHASPTVVLVTLRDDAGGVVLDVADDGVGMTVGDRRSAEQNGHIGLRALDRRISAIGGRWQVRSAPGRGTTVRVRLPR